MNRKYALLLAAPLLLGLNAAWAQDTDEEEAEMLIPAAEQAREQAQLPDERLPEAAAKGLSVAAEATIRLMEDDEDAVTNDVELPELPEQGVAGQQGLDIAADAMAGGKDFGLEMADEARDSAQEATEGRGRAEDLPVDVPGRPDDIPAGPPGT